MYYHLEYSVRHFMYGDTYRGHEIYPTKELRDEGYEPEWIRDGHHMLEVYVPNTSINAWWDFE